MMRKSRIASRVLTLFLFAAACAPWPVVTSAQVQNANALLPEPVVAALSQELSGETAKRNLESKDARSYP